MIFLSGVILLKVKHTLVNMSKGIVYTTVFGEYDDPIEQNLPEGWDWKCFSEKNSLSLYTDSNRNAKKIKILPHRYLQDYEYSIFVDGNVKVIGNIDELINKYLKTYLIQKPIRTVLICQPKGTCFKEDVLIMLNLII